MDRSNGESLEGIKSVKAAISLYGQKFNGKNQELPTKSGELHLAQLGIRRLNETKSSAEREKALAESELLKAKSMVKELSAEIESTNAKVTARKLELQSSRNLQMNGQEADSDLTQELSDTKRSLTRLKLDLVSVSESKVKAEKEIEDSNSRVRSCMAAIEEISKEIEKANEEHALVELARIEAERESREIEAQRKDEASKFSKEIAEVKEKLKVLQDEARQAEDLESKAAVTNADLSVLQSEMELVRAMDRSFENSSGSSLRTVEAELKAAKEELEAIKEEGFQYMSSMDGIRDELIFISKETNLLKKQEGKADSRIQHLNSKLLKAKSKIESASWDEERTRAIVSNLSSALKEMQLETETAKKEKQAIDEETTKTRLKAEVTESKILSTEERLKAAVKELADAKTSEAIALKKMKEVAERTMKNRAAAAASALSMKSSTITISKTEYEYLTNCAASAQVVADKKVAASRAWIEALKAEEEDITTRRVIVEKKIKELRVTEEEEEEEPLIDQKSTTENETRNEDEEEWLNLERRQARRPRKSVAVAATTRRKSNVVRRSSVSHGVRYHARSPSFTIKKKTAMPNLVKFLLRKRSTITQK